MKGGALSRRARSASFVSFVSYFLLLLFFSSVAHASALQKAQELTEEIQIIWFTKNEKRLFVFFKNIGPSTTHTEIGIDGRTYSSTGRGPERRYIDRGPLDQGRLLKDIVLFTIRVTKTERDRILDIIQNGNPDEILANCVSSSLYALKKATGIRVPFPMDRSPVLTAFYMFLMKTTGNARIAKIEFVGTKMLGQLASQDVLFEAAIAGMGMQFTFFIPEKLKYKLATSLDRFLYREKRPTARPK